MSVRDHRNPYLRAKREAARARRIKARKTLKTQRDFVSTRAELARDLLNRLAEI